MSDTDYSSPAECRARHNKLNKLSGQVEEYREIQIEAVGRNGDGGRIAQLQRELQAEREARIAADRDAETWRLKLAKEIKACKEPRKKEFVRDGALTGAAVTIAAVIAELLRSSGIL